MPASPASSSTAAIAAANSASGWPSGKTGILASSSGCSRTVNAAAANSAEAAATRTTRGRRAAATPPRSADRAAHGARDHEPADRTASPRTAGWLQRRRALLARAAGPPDRLTARSSASPRHPPQAPGRRGDAQRHRELVDPLRLEFQGHRAGGGSLDGPGRERVQGHRRAAQLTAIGDPALVPRHATDQQRTLRRIDVQPDAGGGAIDELHRPGLARLHAHAREGHSPPARGTRLAVSTAPESPGRVSMRCMPGPSRIGSHPSSSSCWPREHFVGLRWKPNADRAAVDREQRSAGFPRRSNSELATSRGR